MIFLAKENLIDLYKNKNLSARAIADKFACSENKINYYLKKFNIPKRTISEALYLKHNPKGNPFKILDIKKPEDLFLFGLGIGLYWGEGNKANKNSVRLGNTDPDLILSFVQFLKKIYGVQKKDLSFGLQIFSEMNPERALTFWKKKLGVSRNQFYKVIVTPSRGIGTYKRKAQYGVLTIYFNNTKLRNTIFEEIENIRKMY